MLSPQLRRLLGYVRPYSVRMFTGVVFLAVVALAEGLIVFLIVPIIDRVLNPAAIDSTLPLFTIPGIHKTIYLNHFFPPRIHHVWAVVSISLLVVFVVKAIAEPRDDGAIGCHLGEILDGLLEPAAKRLLRQSRMRQADNGKSVGQPPVRGEVIKRRHQQPGRQIAGGAKDH